MRNQHTPISVAVGIAAAVGLSVIYAIVISAISGTAFLAVQFSLYRFWIIGLVIGFGVQAGLFTYLRRLHRERMGGTLAASGTTSAVAMFACCTHYLVGILPAIGATGIAAIAGQYQRELFIIGALANAVGIGHMASRIRSIHQSQ